MESEPLGSRHFDLVCVGFGATSLALAVALEERRPKDQRVLFLESQSRATWRPCTDNGVSSRLRTPFLDDLVTSENPRSRFTFLNYLRVTGRLVFYANDSQICPAREMFADYLRWCASFFDDKVQYGQRVTAVVPSTSDKKVEGWKVAYVDSNGQKGFVTAKQVVCAVGNVPKTPAPLASPQFQSQVVHSSDCQEAIASLLKARSGSCRLAIVGDGQAAAEVFDHLHGIRGDHHVTWFTRDSVLRGGDQTPFVLDNTKRPTTKMGRALPIELRNTMTPDTKSVVDADLLKTIYEVQYAQTVKEADPAKWKFQIKLSSQLCGAERTAGGLRLSFDSLPSEEFDLVVAATGYDRHQHKQLLSSLTGSLLDGPQLGVDREYRVNIRSGALAPGCGLWLQGSFADGDDRDDGLYPMLAERGRIVADSILKRRNESTEQAPVDRDARL